MLIFVRGLFVKAAIGYPLKLRVFSV
jgi:hypothetical protein